MSFNVESYFSDLSGGNPILYYKGNIDSDLINKVLDTVEEKLISSNEHPRLRKRVYNVLVESLQNLYECLAGQPAFALLRPPGHHASAGSCWGFCFFNNMAVAIEALKQQGRIRSAYILDIDLHFGDGTENILGRKSYVSIHNPGSNDREAYLQEVERELERFPADLIGISAGFDNHRQDWGGLLRTDDYFAMGRMVRDAARRNNGGCFAVLEGGYNEDVLGQNALALINGLSP